MGSTWHDDHMHIDQLIFERTISLSSLHYVFDQLARKMQSPESVKPRPLTVESDDRRKPGYTVEENVRGSAVLQKWLNEGRYD